MVKRVINNIRKLYSYFVLFEECIHNAIFIKLGDYDKRKGVKKDHKSKEKTPAEQVSFIVCSYNIRNFYRRKFTDFYVSSVNLRNKIGRAHV